MGDVGDILGDHKTSRSGGGATTSTTTSTKKKKKPKGMTREVFQLLDGGDDVPSLVPTASSTKIVGSVDRRGGSKPIVVDPSTKVSKWVWTPFKNSARVRDPDAVMHWQRATTVVDDYPFAKLNKKLYVVELPSAASELAKLLGHSNADACEKATGWSFADTKLLFSLCQRFDLRWFVVHDRFTSFSKKKKSLPKLKERFYVVSAALVNAGLGDPSSSSSDLTYGRAFVPAKTRALVRASLATFVYDKEYDEEREKQLETNFSKSKATEREEAALVAEVRRINVRLQKLEAQKSNVSKLTVLEEALAASLGRERGVELRSARLSTQPSADGLGKTLAGKIVDVMAELGVPERPLPTEAVCAAYDALRRSVIKMIAARRIVRDKENELRAIRPDLVREAPPAVVQAVAAVPVEIVADDDLKRKAETASGGGERKRSRR